MHSKVCSLQGQCFMLFWEREQRLSMCMCVGVCTHMYVHTHTCFSLESKSRAEYIISETLMISILTMRIRTGICMSWDTFIPLSKLTNQIHWSEMPSDGSNAFISSSFIDWNGAFILFNRVNLTSSGLKVIGYLIGTESWNYLILF